MGSFDQAEHYYSREVEINPEDALALYNLAVIKEKLNKPQEAVRYYEQFIALKPPAYAAILPSINAKIALLKAQLRSSRDPAVHRSQAND
ncbi:MAG: tetratricopeptide repeat protein, partial [Betaproteobacteria bacterium]